MNEAAPSKPRIHPWSIWLIIIIMMGGLVVYYNYLKTLQRQSQNSRPPYIKRLEDNLKVTRSSGEETSLKELKGKTWLVSHIFTRCPGQCAGIGVELKELQEEFGDDPNFHIVSVSMDPTYDTPDILKRFRETHQLEGDNWWFVTGDPEPVNDYMRKFFFFAPQVKPEKDRDNPNDIYNHDTKIALVDGGAHVRGWYNAFDAMAMDKLRRDLKFVLKEAADKK